MKLTKWQSEALTARLQAWCPGGDAAFMLRRIEEVLATPSEENPSDESIYQRFMAEWKQVGVWAGGKPVRARLARLRNAKKLDEVWAGLERLRNDPNRPSPEFVPRPMTWLNQERWNDDPYPARAGRQSAASAAASISLSPLDLSNAQSVDSRLGQQEMNMRGASLRNEIERGAL